MNIAWCGLVDQKYWDYIAKCCIPSWTTLPGSKFLITDNMSLPVDCSFTLVDYETVYNRNSQFNASSKKVDNFWKKMQSQVWAVRNLTEFDFVVLFDTDIEVLSFDINMFLGILNSLRSSECIWATGESQRRGHDSGFIIVNTAHPGLQSLFTEYENIWESGKIFELDKAYDGNAVELLLQTYPSIKIRNTDCGKGMHLYDLGPVHWGSKEPKEQRREARNGEDVVRQRLLSNPPKVYKNKP